MTKNRDGYGYEPTDITGHRFEKNISLTMPDHESQMYYFRQNQRMEVGGGAAEKTMGRVHQKVLERSEK